LVTVITKETIVMKAMMLMKINPEYFNNENVSFIRTMDKKLFEEVYLEIFYY